MNTLVWSLILTPWVASVLVLLAGKTLVRAVTITTMAVLSAVSIVLLFAVQSPLRIDAPEWVGHAMMAADFALLGLFAVIGVRARNPLVIGLTIAQAILAAVLIPRVSALGHHGAPILVDRLSVFMYLLINVVSGLILIYALQYIEDEDVAPKRRRSFMAILLWFVGVMNFIVSADNLEWFFLLFELTTLASWMLIRFRLDAKSEANALRALWMNQIGGVAILLALFVSTGHAGLATVSMSELVAHTPGAAMLLPVTLIAVAAMIKGAQMPFSGWLLGAMVAPTPVSALLHSSTMVKIAPYVILRLSPALRGTAVSQAIMLECAFVFVVAALAALSRDNFKEILAQSTIALLGLMILLGALGTETAVLATLIVMFFHGVSKCLLFLSAGIMEKVFHVKYLKEQHDEHALNGHALEGHAAVPAHERPLQLAEMGPRTSFFVSFGFLSLMLPPFGAFIGKWIGVEILAGSSRNKLIDIAVLLAVIIGSAILGLLYLRVVGFLVMRGGDREAPKQQHEPLLYTLSPSVLVGFLLAGTLGFVPLVMSFFVPIAQGFFATPLPVSSSGLDLTIGASHLPGWALLAALLLLPVVLLVARRVHFQGVDRVQEYNCGEKEQLDFAPHFFSFDRYTPYFMAIGLLFFVAIVITGRIS